MSRRGGFTLIEMLLTLGILAIGLVSVFSVLPSVTEYSRSLRDDDRMRAFADSVFASADWAAAAETEEERDRAWTVSTVAGEVRLQPSEEEVLWPGADVPGELVPRLWYRLNSETNGVSSVEWTLTVRPFARPEPTEFRHSTYQGPRPW